MYHLWADGNRQPSARTVYGLLSGASAVREETGAARHQRKIGHAPTIAYLYLDI